MKLTKNAYSPASLAKELEFLISATFIRSAIRKGQLKAHRFGGKNLVIKQSDAQKWLDELPSATEPTNYKGARRRGRRKMSEEDKQRLLNEAARRPKRRKRISKKDQT